MADDGYRKWEVTSKTENAEMEGRWRHLFDDGPFTGNRSTGNRLSLFCDGDQTLHAKNVTVDGGLISVGYYNIDRWSSQHNLEANVAAISPEVAERLEGEFFMNVARAREISPSEWRRRPFYKQSLQFSFYHLAML
jgi:phosphatidylserine/phosphatidylglycerophosphate/cardiolipin synthase-like enzyme